MIVFEKLDAFVMVKQHDHAHLSGQAADHWDISHFKGAEKQQDVAYAIYQHDRSWIGLDETPIWNDRGHVPYSFSDFPLIPKLRFYAWGLDEIEKENPYAALLCSLHYASFFEKATQSDSQAFLMSERKRQERLKQYCHLTTSEEEDVLHYHFRLLQFCDDVSLYVCLNEPGVSKEKEHPWYRNGFKNSEIFDRENKQQVIARWMDNQHIVFSPFPFQESFDAQLKIKIVPKEIVREEGIAEAYKSTSWSNRKVTIMGHEH